MLIFVLGLLVALFVGFTLLPLSKKTAWWVRGADFPRLQFAVFGLVLLVAQALLVDHARPLSWVLAAITFAALVYQAWWIRPYTPLARKEVKTAAPSSGQGGNRIRIMSANILMPNRRAEDLLRVVRAERPDVLVTLETNQWWEEALRGLETDYPHRLGCPLDNLYGMHLYSRFPLEDAKIQFLVEPGTPSMHTLLVLPSGRRICLHCLHPAPPGPTENPTSKERDAELVMVGRAVSGAKFPVIVSGDLNDVAWSATTRLFRKVSGLLDPRIGRGMYNTFHAQYRLCRWPVDHIFHSKHFTVARLSRLPAGGSDHFPVVVELALETTAPARQDALPADEADEAEAQEKMRDEAVTASDVHRPGEGKRKLDQGSKAAND